MKLRFLPTNKARYKTELVPVFCMPGSEFLSCDCVGPVLLPSPIQQLVGWVPYPAAALALRWEDRRNIMTFWMSSLFKKSDEK